MISTRVSFIHLVFKAVTLIERAVDLTAIGGQYANQRPTEFLCLTLKLLQLQPSKDIIVEFLKNEDFK